MTASRPDIALPIDVRGTVCLDAPSGRRVTLEASGPELQLVVPGWAELKQLGPRSWRSRRRTLAAAARTLEKMRLTLIVNVGESRTLGLGRGVRTSLLARFLGLPSADLRLATVIQLLRTRATAS